MGLFKELIIYYWVSKKNEKEKERELSIRRANAESINKKYEDMERNSPFSESWHRKTGCYYDGMDRVKDLEFSLCNQEKEPLITDRLIRVLGKYNSDSITICGFKDLLSGKDYQRIFLADEGKLLFMDSFYGFEFYNHKTPNSYRDINAIKRMSYEILLWVNERLKEHGIVSDLVYEKYSRKDCDMMGIEYVWYPIEYARIDDYKGVARWVESCGINMRPRIIDVTNLNK